MLYINENYTYNYGYLQGNSLYDKNSLLEA